MNREYEAPLANPLAYFITWATYGTWLPGDERGWVDYRHGWQLPDPVKRLEAAAKLTEDACRLDVEQRNAVQQQMAETCSYRGWTLHAVNCRTNHVHVVLTAAVEPKKCRTQLKAWCTRKLKALAAAKKSFKPIRDNWWAERGSQRYINDEVSLEATILYVRDCQDTNPKR